MKKKNVLLLSMSTLPQSLVVQNYYFIEENGERKDFYGYSQLEPITKFLIQKLKNQGEKLDKIVIMTSKEALKDQNKTAPCPAVPFYLQRINEFVSEKHAQEFMAQDHDYFERMMEEKEEWKSNPKGGFRVSPQYADAIKAYLSKYQLTEAQERSSVKGIQVEIVKLYDEEQNGEEVLVTPKEEINIFFEVIDHIKATGDDIDLYLDMQGGDRNAIVQMNAIVNLLEDQGVKTEARYAIAFDRNNDEHPINEVSEKYTAYQLIGAMQAFKKYGRGQSLIEYFKTPKKDRDKKILSAIETASDAIRLCDIGKFDTAVSEIAAIKKEIETEKTGAVQKEKSELDIVFEDIQKDYGKLLDQSTGMYIAKIKWCLEKGFIQQALTIIESKMPEYLYDREIITVNMEEEITGRKKQNGEWMGYANTKKKISEILEAFKITLKRNYVSNEHILNEQLSKDNTVETIRENGENKTVIQYEIPEEIETVEQLLREYPQENYKTVKFIWINKYSYRIVYQIPSEYRRGKKEKYMTHFLKIHWILKRQRNNINHSSENEDRFPKEKLERYIRFYVELGELLEIDPV